jgi:hypothetical protein
MLPTTSERRFARGSLFSVVLAVAVVALAAAGAQAAPPPDPPGTVRGENERIETDRGYVEFLHHGEILEAKDKRLDGRGIRAHLVFGLERRDFAPDTLGPGGFEIGTATDRVADRLPKSSNLSHPDGQTVSIQMCYTKDGVDVECSRWQDAVA